MAAPAKKGMGGILALMGGAPEGEDDPMAEKVEAAGDLISAVKSGDAEGVAHAFQAMYDACAALGGEEFEDEGSDFEEE